MIGAAMACLACSAPTSGIATCTGPLAVQILGSGGPVPEGHRASSGYVVWMDGRSRVLVDAGGGTFLRFGEAKATLEDLDLIAITHLHADHVADLIALVKAGFFSDRHAAMPISGPSGNAVFPGLKNFLHTEFGLPDGAFAYLSWALDGSEGLFELEPIEVNVSNDAMQVVLDIPGLLVTAAPVRHGSVPALGYLIRTPTHSIAFSGDQNGDNPAFWEMAKNADVLVMHLAVPENADPIARKLHAVPSVIGAQAAAAHVKHLVLSHLMARSVTTLASNLAIIRRQFHGAVSVASDLQCFSP